MVNRILRHLALLSPILLLSVADAGLLQAQVQLQVSPTSVSLSALYGSLTPVTQTIQIASSGDAVGTHLSFAAFVSNSSSAGTSWLTITGTPTGTTPSTVTLSASATNLAAGVYAGQIQVLSAGSATNPTVNVPVTFTVGQLSAAPSMLSFGYQIGGSVPPAQNLTLSAINSGLHFTTTVATTNGGSWLEAAPTSGNAPGTLAVSINSALLGGLTAGTYNGSITLTPSSTTPTPLVVPVTLSVTQAPQVSVSPTSLSFAYQIGGVNNVTQQNLSITSSAAPVAFGVTASVSPNPAGAQWLVVLNQTATATPATLTIGVVPGALPAGTYAGQISILAPGLPTITVGVTLLVTTNPLLSLSPPSLTFAYELGTSAPASQSVDTASTGAALGYSTFVTTSTGGDWLTAQGGNATPNPITVSVNPTALGVGVFNGNIQVAAAGAANSPQNIPVTLTVSNLPLIQASASALTFLYQVGQTGPTAQVLAMTSSTGQTLSYTLAASTAGGGSWLAVSPGNGATPGNVSVSVLTSLAPGTYTGTVTITATNPSGDPVPNSPLAIPITYYVSDNPLLMASPTSLSFSAAPGGQATAKQVTLTSTGAALNYTIASQTITGGPWLAIASQPGSTPGSFVVSALAAILSPGTYTAKIEVTATNPAGPAVADSPVVIPVTLQVIAGTLAATPSSLTFDQVLGGAAPAVQNISVTGTGSQALNYTAVASTSNGINWLTVTPNNGSTPATLNVAANGSNLSPGTYQGNITITAPNALGSPQTVAVTLNVAAAATLSVTPASLKFSSQVGGAAPAAQTVAVAASPGTLSFTAAAATSNNSGSWLSVTPASGSTPTNLSVSVNPAGLATGTYNGTIVVSAASAGNSPQTVNVTLTVAAPPPPMPTSVQNAGSQTPGAVSPGEIVSIYGTNLGPAAGVFGTITNHSLSTTIAGIQVSFDNNLAPLLYVSATQINAVVPFELTGEVQTHMTISNNGSVATALDLAVAQSAPGLFTLTQNGAGPGAILNQNGSVNGLANPAAPGSVIVLYVTGLGETSPPGVTGNITPGDGTGLKAVTGVTVMVGGLTGKVIYAGSAPSFVEGAMQVNVQLPANVPSGPQPLVLSLDGVSSRPGVTVAIQ
jgi:uncharacterized protein (TIGR03437 family)